MKRRFKATYYEYGLTERVSKKFFFLFSACFWRAWLECKYPCMACVKIEEIGE